MTTALQVHIGALRKVVGGRIVTTSAGYRLDVATDEIDAFRFGSVVTGVRRTDLLRQSDRSANGVGPVAKPHQRPPGV